MFASDFWFCAGADTVRHAKHEVEDLPAPRLSQMLGLSVALDAFSESAGITTLNKVRLQSLDFCAGAVRKSYFCSPAIPQ